MTFINLTQTLHRAVIEVLTCLRSYDTAEIDDTSRTAGLFSEDISYRARRVKGRIPSHSDMLASVLLLLLTHSTQLTH